MSTAAARPLYAKLGIDAGTRLAVVNEPEGFLQWFIPTLPEGVRLFDRATDRLDVILFFSDSRSHLARRFKPLAAYLHSAGGLWVAYPKKSSRRETDLTFEVVQRIGLGHGLVDNKSCAVDEDWTAVRFVYRRADRPLKRDGGRS